MHQTGLAHARLPDERHHLAVARSGVLQGLAQLVQLGVTSYKARQPPRRRHLQAPPQGTGSHQLKNLHRLGQPLDRHRPQGMDLHQALHQAQGGGGEQNAARGGELLHTRRQVRGLPHGRIVHVQIVADGAHHDFARVQPDAELQRNAMRAAHLLGVAAQGGLHGQGGVAGAQGMVFMGNGGAEQGHDAVTQHLIHRALEAVHGVHHVPQGRIEEPLGGFGIEVADEFGGAFEIGKQHRHLLALAFQRGARRQNLLDEMARRVGLRGIRWQCRGARLAGQRCTTAAAELFSRLIGEPTRRAGQCEWRPTLGTETAPGTVLGLATGTLHPRRSSVVS